MRALLDAPMKVLNAPFHQALTFFALAAALTLLGYKQGRAAEREVWLPPLPDPPEIDPVSAGAARRAAHAAGRSAGAADYGVGGHAD